MGYSVGIVGGGAAGMMAAITAAGCGASVTILEGNDRPGRKLLSTGNGKCNLGNEKLDINEYYTSCPEFLEKCLARFGTEDTAAFFQGIGLLLKSKNGYLYPMSEQASSVLDVLRHELCRQGVQIITDCKVDNIEITGRADSRAECRNEKTDKYICLDECPQKAGICDVELNINRQNNNQQNNNQQNKNRQNNNQQNNNRQNKNRQNNNQQNSNRQNNSRRIRLESRGGIYCFDRVILACGGRAAPRTGSDGSGYRLAEKLGHSLVPVVPALVQMRCREDFFKSIAGVRAEATVTVITGNGEPVQERGELQLTDYGISGIPVFQISRVMNYILRKEKDVEVRIDFLPDITEEALAALAAERMHLRKGCTVEAFFTGMLNKKLMLLFIRLAGLKATEDASAADPEKLRMVYRLCKCFTVHVSGSNSYDNAQVCAGGVPLNEVTAHLESRKAPGVYFAGEILDVDGKCGGYNLQWAWCSGHIAGMAASR